MNFKNIDYENIYKKIKHDGFYIYKDLIDLKTYKKCRNESIKFFEEVATLKKQLQTPVRGDIGAGMQDILGYENNHYWKLTRGCYFPWNRTNKSLMHTIRLSRELSKLRNQICGFDPLMGSKIEDNGYIQYTSLSLYDKDKGFLKAHSDGHSKNNEDLFIHFKVELTHKYLDYQKGGFYFWDNHGKEIDISSEVKPCDVIFFNGSNFHEIKKIEGELGRIALFEIPTYVSEKSRLHNYTSGSVSILRRGKNKIKNFIDNYIKKYSKNIIGISTKEF